MPPEIIALIDRPVLLLIVLAVGAAIGIGVERLVESEKRAKRRVYWQGRNARKPGGKVVSLRPASSKATPERSVPDAAEQLRLVMDAKFAARPLLNRPERRVLAHLDKCLADDAPGWRAMGQVSLGEILSSENPDAYLAINSKRLDLLIVDAECRPLHAVEFQGEGHHQGNAAARDAVKKEALRRAGIGYIELVSGDTPGELRAIVRKLVARQLPLAG